MTNSNGTTESVDNQAYPNLMNGSIHFVGHQPLVERYGRRQRAVSMPGMPFEIKLVATDLEAEACRQGEWSRLNYHQATTAAFQIVKCTLGLLVGPRERLFAPTLDWVGQNQLSISVEKTNMADGALYAQTSKHYGIFVRPLRTLTRMVDPIVKTNTA